VIIDEERRFIYVATPRTGSTSTAHGLWRASGSPGKEKSLRPWVGSYHHKGKQHAPFEGLYPDYKIFTNVRNPYDRFISLTYPAVSGCEAQRVLEDIPPSHREWYQPQTEYVPEDLQGGFVLRFEHLKEDFKRMLAAVGLPDVTLEHMKSTRGKKKNWRSHYRQHEGLVKAVEDYYRSDLDRWGYRWQ